MVRRSRPRRSGWRWAGAILVLAVAAWVAAWNKQPPSGNVAQAPPGREGAPGSAFKPAESMREKKMPRPEPAATTGAQPEVSAAAPERPSRDRMDRPGSENPEFEQWRRTVAQEFRAADADGDGFLSRDEARGFPLLAKDFERVDADGDGRISMQEFMRVRRLQAQQRMPK